MLIAIALILIAWTVEMPIAVSIILTIIAALKAFGSIIRIVYYTIKNME